MNHPKPENVTQEAWDVLTKSVESITEHFSNVAIFVNWVDEAGQTQHGHILQGNTFAIQHHINKWVDGDFEVQDEEDEDNEGWKKQRA